MRKLDPGQAQVQRQLRPSGQSKRMKKRKELDALLGDRGRSSYEQLHRVDGDMAVSSSSREADIYFQRASNHISSFPRRGGRSIAERTSNCTSKRLFCLCLPVCILALVAACVTSSIGIVWMQLQLKAEMESIKDKIFKLERWKEDQPPALANAQASLASLMRDVMQMKEGDGGIRTLNSEIALLSSKVDELPGAEAAGSKEEIDELEKGVSGLSSDISGLRRIIEEVSGAEVQLAARYSTLSASVDRLRAQLQSIDGAVQGISSRSLLSSSAEKGINSTLHLLMERIATLETSPPSNLTRETQDHLASLYAHLSQNVSSADVTICALQNRTNKMLSRLEAVESRLSHSTVWKKSRETPQSNPDVTSSVVGGAKKTSQRRKEGGGVDVKEHDVIVSPSDKTRHRVGDTTTSFTQIPVHQREER